MTSYKLNDSKNGIELYFDSCPDINTRENLKANGWRWSRFGGCWYNRQTEENLNFAKGIASGKAENIQHRQESKPFELNLENLKNCVNFDKWSSREWSDVATISRAIKTFMKKAGIPCSVSSQRFSGGDSVTVETEDLKFETEQKLSSLFHEYFEGGHFNGMEDIYEYARGKDDRPTTKYFFYTNKLSDSLKNQIEEYLKNSISGLNFDDWCERNHWINKAHQGKLNDCPVFGI